MGKKFCTVFGVALLICLLNSFGHGAQVTISLKGTNPSPNPNAGFTGDEIIQFSISYNTNIGPGSYASYWQEYRWWDESITSSGTISCHPVSATKEQITIRVGDAPSGNYAIWLQHNPNGGDSYGYDTFSSGIYTAIWFINLVLKDQDGTAFGEMSSGLLPETMNPDDFEGKILWTRLRDDDYNYTDVSWTVEELSIVTDLEGDFDGDGDVDGDDLIIFSNNYGKDLNQDH